MPSSEDISSFYPKAYYSYQVHRERSFLDRVRENTIRAAIDGLNGFSFFWKCLLFFTRRRFQGLLPLFRNPGGKFLDIGCGDASNLRILKEYGWDTYGIEISKDAAESAQQEGFNVTHSTLENYAPDVTFDAIRLWHVLEHLPDPHKSAAKIRSLLNTGGVVYLAIPNIRSLNALLFGKYWIGYDIPRHLIDYSFSSFRLLVEKHGFRILSYRYASTSGLLCSVSNFLNSLSKRKFRLANNQALVILTYPYDFLTDLFSAGDILYIQIQKI